MWRSHWLPYFLAPPLCLFGFLVGDNVVGVFLLGFGGLVALDAAAWTKAALSGEDFYPAADWTEIWREAYNPRSSAILWSLLAVLAAAITALRFSRGPEELFLLIMVPFGAYLIAAVLIFRADIIRYAQRTGLQPPPRLDAGEARFDTTNREDR